MWRGSTMGRSTAPGRPRGPVCVVYCSRLLLRGGARINNHKNAAPSATRCARSALRVRQSLVESLRCARREQPTAETSRPRPGLDETDSHRQISCHMVLNIHYNAQRASCSEHLALPLDLQLPQELRLLLTLLRLCDARGRQGSLGRLNAQGFELPALGSIPSAPNQFGDATLVLCLVLGFLDGSLRWAATSNQGSWV